MQIINEGKKSRRNLYSPIFVTDTQNNSRPGSIWEGREKLWQKAASRNKLRSPRD